MEEERTTPRLSPAEQEDAQERSSPAASVVHAAIRAEGERELSRTSSALAWSALAAGLSMGFSMVAEGLLTAGLPDAPWRPLVAKLGYSAGFVVVILARQQLFTENTLTPVLPLLERRDRRTLRNVLRLWSIVLVANLAGAFLFAQAVAHTTLFELDTKSAFHEIGTAAMQGSPGTWFLQGIFAGWLIALMVWMLPAAETAKLLVIVAITWLVGVAELTHIIAGAVEVFYLFAIGSAGAGQVLLWLGATLAGNVAGGLALTTALNHAQVVSKAAA